MSSGLFVRCSQQIEKYINDYENSKITRIYRNASAAQI